MLVYITRDQSGVEILCTYSLDFLLHADVRCTSNSAIYIDYRHLYWELYSDTSYNIVTSILGRFNARITLPLAESTNLYQLRNTTVNYAYTVPTRTLFRQNFFFLITRVYNNYRVMDELWVTVKLTEIEIKSKRLYSRFYMTMRLINISLRFYVHFIFHHSK